MNKPAAFRATYSDCKLIKTRQCVQVIFEVPLADFNNAYDVLGGLPDAAKETWFAIAPLRADNQTSVQTPEQPAEKERTSWRELTPTTQACIRCSEPTFWAFLREEHDKKCDSDSDAATVVRKLCGVNTRSALSTNHAARVIWHQLDTQFLTWKLAENVA